MRTFHDVEMTSFETLMTFVIVLITLVVGIAIAVELQTGEPMRTTLTRLFG